MKKILILFLIVCYSQQTWSQDEVNFEFSDGINNPVLKQRMERQMSMLLTAINKAESSGGMINFNGIEIDPVASQSIT